MRDARLAAIREEAADMFATLPSGAVRVRAMQLLAMVDARDAEIERLRLLAASFAAATAERDAARAALAECERQRDEWERAARKVAVESIREIIAKPPLRWTSSPPTSPVPMVLVRKIKDAKPGHISFGKVYLHEERGLWFTGDWTQAVEWLARDGAEWCPIPPPAEPVDAEPTKETT